MAESIVRAIAPGAKVLSVKLPSANSTADAFETMRSVYRDVIPDCNLRPENFIADFTGGTAAMSAGMVTAALLHGQKLEYMTQHGDRRLAEKVGENWRAYDCAEIREKKLLIQVQPAAEFRITG